MSYPGPPPQGLGPLPLGKPGKAPDRRCQSNCLVLRSSCLVCFWARLCGAGCFGCECVAQSRGLRPRRGGRRRRRRSPQRGARRFLRGRKCGTPPGRGPFVRLVSKEGRSLQVRRLCETFGRGLRNPWGRTAWWVCDDSLPLVQCFKLPLVQCYSRVASSPGHSQAHGLAIGSSYLQRTLAEGISWDGPRDA